MAIMIAGMAADQWRATGGKRPSRATADNLMRLLQDREVIFPRPAGKSARPRQTVKKP
jgi:hypothetical protein